jgi:hypothetical protein
MFWYGNRKRCLAVFLGIILLSFPVASLARHGGPGATVIHETVVVQPGGAGSGVQLPPGYYRGKKKGWGKHGSVIPPGLHKHLMGKGKYPRGL